MWKRLTEFKPVHAVRLGLPGRCVFALLLVLLLAPPVFAEEPVLGRCDKGLSREGSEWQECALGDYVADAMVAVTGCDGAILPGACLAKGLPGVGEITRQEIEPLFEMDDSLVTAELTSGRLLELLETSVSALTVNERETLDEERSASEEYLQFSGLTVRCDVSAPVGQRILRASMGDTELAWGDGLTWTIALPRQFAQAKSIGFQETDLSMSDCVAQYVTRQQTVEYPDGNRMKMIGAHTADIVSYFSTEGIVMLTLLFLAMGVMLTLRRQRRIRQEDEITEDDRHI